MGMTHALSPNKARLLNMSFRHATLLSESKAFPVFYKYV